MAPTFSFAVVLAFLLVVAQSVEFGSSKNQFRFLLNGAMLTSAKAGYTPTTDIIPGTEMLMEGSFITGGSLHITKSFEATCTVPFQTHSVAAGSCIKEDSISYKFQLANANSCAGATVQYFHDDACTLYAGSSEISAASQSCHAASEAKVFTGLTCTAEASVSVLSAVDTFANAAPSAEPTAFPTASTQSTVTVVVSQQINGVTVDDYNNDKAAYDATLTQTIALSMDGVAASDVTINSVTAAPSSEVRALVHGAAFLRSLAASDAIVVKYTVVTVSKYTSDQLFAQLTASVDSGAFTTTMNTIAATEGATGLETSTAAAPEDVTPSDDNNDNKLSKGDIAGIVIGVFFGVVLIAVAVYFLIFGCGGKAAGHHHNMVPVEL